MALGYMWKLLPPTLPHNFARARAAANWEQKRAFSAFDRKNPPPPPFLPGGKIAHCDRKILTLFPGVSKSWDTTGRVLPNGNRNERTGTPISLSQCAALPRPRAAPHCPVHSNVARGPAGPPGASYFGLAPAGDWSRAWTRPSRGRLLV